LLRQAKPAHCKEGNFYGIKETRLLRGVASAYGRTNPKPARHFFRHVRKKTRLGIAILIKPRGAAG
jgi:hypothetical protein